MKILKNNVNRSKPIMIITKVEFNYILGDALAETLELELLEMRDEVSMLWKEKIGDIVEYIFYNYARIEVV